MRRQPGVELRLRPSLTKNPCVVEPLIGVVELLEGFFRFAVTIGRAAGELIGQGKDAARLALAEKPEIARKIVEAIMEKRAAAAPA